MWTIVLIITFLGDGDNQDYIGRLEQGHLSLAACESVANDPRLQQTLEKARKTFKGEGTVQKVSMACMKEPNSI